MARAVIFDLNMTLYDPFSDALYPGVPHMLEDLARVSPLFIYSKRGGDKGLLLRRLGIYEHFHDCAFVDAKTEENLREFIGRHDLAVGQAVMVGDLVDSELRVAGGIGMETVWARHGIIPAELPPDSHMPTYAADSVDELHKLLRMLD